MPACTSTIPSFVGGASTVAFLSMSKISTLSPTLSGLGNLYFSPSDCFFITGSALFSIVLRFFLSFARASADISFAFRAFSSSSTKASACALVLEIMRCASCFALSISRSAFSFALRISFSAFCFSVFAFAVRRFAFSICFSRLCLRFSRVPTTSSNCRLSLETSSFALSTISSSIPSLLVIAKALLLPGTPIKSLYVGLKVVTSNSQQAFSTPSVRKANSFNSA